MKGSELRKLAKNMPVFIVEISLIIIFYYQKWNLKNKISLQLDQFSIPQCFKTMFVVNVSFVSNLQELKNQEYSSSSRALMEQ